jgi:hypothetical protein
MPISHRTTAYTRDNTIPGCSQHELQLGSETTGHSSKPNIRAAQARRAESMTGSGLLPQYLSVGYTMSGPPVCGVGT